MTIIAIITTSSVPFIINHLLVDSSSKGQLLTARLLGVAMVMIIIKRDNIYTYMQKAGDCGDISPQFFLDFLQNFRLRTRNQYCTQAIA